MPPYPALLTSGLLALCACNAGDTGYLPAAGPTPLRFSPPRDSLPHPALPPLLMKTPPPVDPDALTNAPSMTPSGFASGAGGMSPELSLGEGTPPEPEVYGAASLTPTVEPYAGGVIPEPEGGWWRILVTNSQGFLSVPVPRVGFVPPAVSAPPSRATYTVTP